MTEFKAHLSKYLRLAARGTVVRVNDRDEPVAQLVAVTPDSHNWYDRLASRGGVRLGNQQWRKLRISSLERPVDIQDSLRAIRDE